MNKTQSIRTGRLHQIEQSLKQCLKEKRKILYNECMVEICNIFNISRRTAVEYFTIVIGRLKIKKDKICLGKSEDIKNTKLFKF